MLPKATAWVAASRVLALQRWPERSLFGLCKVGSAYPPTGALAAGRSVTRLRYLPLPSRARLEFGTLVTVYSRRRICDGLRLTRTSHLCSGSRRRPDRWTLRLRPRRITVLRETSTRVTREGRLRAPREAGMSVARHSHFMPQVLRCARYAMLDMRTASILGAKAP